MILNIKQQVCSVELSKRLKELGVLQDTLFYWNINPRPKNQYSDSEIEAFLQYGKDLIHNQISAFTVAEIGKLLPPHIYSVRHSEGNEWKCIDGDKSRLGLMHIRITEAECRAAMLIYLLENKLMEIPK